MQNESKRTQNQNNTESNEGDTAVTEDLKEEESEQTQTQAVAKEEEEQKPAATNPVQETPHQEPVLLMTDAMEMEVPVVENQEEQTLFSWFTDPVANSIILVLSILCFLLGRKWQALLQELQTLNAAANSI
eukprot:scaffold25436_cov52-Attheya_sp.AAC.1